MESFIQRQLFHSLFLCGGVGEGGGGGECGYLLPVGRLCMCVASSAVVLAVQCRPTSRAAWTLTQIVPRKNNLLTLFRMHGT